MDYKDTTDLKDNLLLVKNKYGHAAIRNTCHEVFKKLLLKIKVAELTHKNLKIFC